MRLCNWLLAALLLWWPASACAAPTFPPLTGRVVDGAGLLSGAQKQQLEQQLAAFEAQTADQIVVVTLQSLDGYDIADYGYQLGRAWGIGQKGKNNGALLIVAPAERDVRIEVGYGLEGTLTDAASSVIINRVILPRFRAGDYPGGIVAGTTAILKVLGGDDSLVRAAQAQPPGETTDLPPWVIILIVVIFIVIRLFGGFYIGPRGGGWGGGGGGFGGGGFNGGGGSFGGGGASGKW